MWGLRWVGGEAEAVEPVAWIDEVRALEVLAATEKLKDGCDRGDQHYKMLDDRGQVVILNANEELVLSGSWVTKEIYALRMTTELAEHILDDVRLEVSLQQGIAGWDVTPAIRFAMAIHIYVMQGARQGETVLNRRQYEAICRAMEQELRPGHELEFGPGYREGVTIQTLWNLGQGLKEPQPRFEMIDWDFQQPLLTTVAVKIPQVPWLNRSYGLPPLSPAARFDAYLGYLENGRLQAIEVMLDTNLERLTCYAKHRDEEMVVIFYPGGGFLTQVVERYQLRPYPQYPKVFWVPTYTMEWVQPSPQDFEVVRLMRLIFEAGGDDHPKIRAKQGLGHTSYAFYPAHEYGRYWALFYEIYPAGVRDTLDHAMDYEDIDWSAGKAAIRSTELKVLADPTPVTEGGPFVPCLKEFMEHLNLVDCYIWVDDLQIYPYLDEQPPPKHLIGRVFDLFHLRELQGSLKIQLGQKILFHQWADKMLVPPEGEIYEAIEHWHEIP